MAFVSRKEKTNMEQTCRHIHNGNLAKFKSGQTACGASWVHPHKQATEWKYRLLKWALCLISLNVWG